MPVKRKALAFILIVIFAVSAAAWLVYTQVSELQNQINELQAQNDELQDQIGELQNQNSALQDKLDKMYEASPVQVTAVERIGWTPIVGLTIGSHVNVTVQNKGTTELSGLTLTVRLVNNNTEVGRGYVKQIDRLGAGESREFSGDILYGLGISFKIESIVKLGDIVLDEHIGANDTLT
jgi:predicted PurR-regulated permease PerM